MVRFDRREVLIGVGTSLLAGHPAWAEGAAADIAHRLAEAEQAGRVFGLHSLLVSDAGQLVFEHYETGEDETLGHPRATVSFGPEVPHDLRSVSKSVVALAYGIALAEGKVPAPEAGLATQLPEYADLLTRSGKDRLTIHHVLSMTLGLEWDELKAPYGASGNSWNAMTEAPDPYRYVLERAVVAEPGERWIYCGGATALLGLLIARGTGEPLSGYCRRALFDPLQCGPFDWYRGPHGESIAASGLRMLPRDLLKIGQLVLARGLWNGQRIVPEDWIKRATTPSATIAGDYKYGYQWYMGLRAGSTPQDPPRFISGVGWGGQHLHMLPRRDLVVVIHCGNYARPGREQRNVVNTLLSEVVLPSFVSRI